MRRAHLARLLDAHAPADDTERGHLEAMRRLVDGPGDPFCRDRFAPGHFTASGFVLSPERDALLLIFHSKLLRWLQPGGHIEPEDDDVNAAARREVAEETGLGGLLPGDDGGLFDVDVHQIPPLRGAPSHGHFDLRFLFVARHRDAHADTDALRVRWVPLGAVEESETDASVMRAVHKLRHG